MAASLDSSNLFLGNLEVAKFVESKHGKLMLLNVDGHVFNTVRKNVDGTKVYWRCRENRRKIQSGESKCLAKAITKGFQVISWTGEHNHDVATIQLHN